jgi:hypothetical protein
MGPTCKRQRLSLLYALVEGLIVARRRIGMRAAETPRHLWCGSSRAKRMFALTFRHKTKDDRGDYAATAIGRKTV